MQVLKLPEVQKRVGLSRSSIYAAIANRSFPAPIKLGSSENARSVGWIAEEIDKYLAVDGVKQHCRLNDNHLCRLDGDDWRRLRVDGVAPLIDCR